MKRITFIPSLLAVLLCVTQVKSQELETIILAREDAAKVTQAYLAPAFRGLIYNMNSGWYHTAKVHKKFGFDLSFGISSASIPSEEEIFNIAALNLSSNTTVTNGVDTSPTLAGSNTITPAQLRYTTSIQGQEVSADFTLPTGIKEDLPINAIIAPAIQVGFGLPYKLETMLRFVPKVGSKEVKGGLFGIGLKKEITDWFGPLDKLPLHISLLAAYTNMGIDYVSDSDNTNNSDGVTTQNASTEFRLNAFTFQAVASLNFPIINIYGGLGYNRGSTSLDMLGDYTLTYQPTNNALPAVQETVTDPFSLKESTGSFNTTIGARLSLGFFKIFGSYTLQKYNTINVGMAFSFR